MAFNLVQEYLGGSARFEASGASKEAEMQVKFADGVDVELGRGTTDTAVTYIALRDTNGAQQFVTVDGTGTLAVSATRP